MSDCCDDEDDACQDDNWHWYDDEPSSPPKEEPDCHECNDSGCPVCQPHPEGCDCADCANAHVIAHEFLQDIDDGLIEVGPFADEPPF